MEKMKVVGRKKTAPLIEDLKGLLKIVNQVRGKALIPSGVYRFKTFEEADRWMIKTIASTHAHRNSKIS